MTALLNFDEAQAFFFHGIWITKGSIYFLFLYFVAKDRRSKFLLPLYVIIRLALGFTTGLLFVEVLPKALGLQSDGYYYYRFIPLIFLIRPLEWWLLTKIPRVGYVSKYSVKKYVVIGSLISYASDIFALFFGLAFARWC